MVSVSIRDLQGAMESAVPRKLREDTPMAKSPGVGEEGAAGLQEGLGD